MCVCARVRACVCVCVFVCARVYLGCVKIVLHHFRSSKNILHIFHKSPRAHLPQALILFCFFLMFMDWVRLGTRLFRLNKNTRTGVVNGVDLCTR